MTQEMPQQLPKLLLISSVFVLAVQTVLGGHPKGPTVITTSGILHGLEEYGVLSFKGIPYGQPPVRAHRWEPPIPFISKESRNATMLGPSCIQQFLFAQQNLTQVFNFGAPSPPESEDCLFLNVWVPATSDDKKPVIFWIHGGGFAFGSASLPVYDGTSFALNQDIILVSINYRMNVYGFPGAEELFRASENLGFMDQDLALQWVQQNIAAFGGDPDKVTIMGESAGGQSVSYLIQRYVSNPPFRAAIVQSGARAPTSIIPDFMPFDTLSKAVNCTQRPGPERLSCMKATPPDVIRTWADGPRGLSFSPVVDNVTAFFDTIQRIQQKKTAKVPVLAGVMQDDGATFVIGETSLPNFLNTTLQTRTSADEVRASYPGLTDIQIIRAVFRDILFLCRDARTTGAYVLSGENNVYRYIYGAVFDDLQFVPDLGAFHGSELPEVFGTYNASTATPSEVTLSATMQTIWANFAKHPTVPPAVNWPRYVPGNDTRTLAKLAHHDNVELSSVVEVSLSGLNDGPCDKLWNNQIVF